jgi:hypothetical protein
MRRKATRSGERCHANNRNHQGAARFCHDVTTGENAAEIARHISLSFPGLKNNSFSLSELASIEEQDSYRS